MALALTAVTFWLTPSRLSDAVNREASKYLKADVEVTNLRFTFWSSFPRLNLYSDSITVRSRVFDSLPASQRSLLWQGADSLLAAESLSGGINIRQLLRGRVVVHDLTLSGFDLRMAALSDSVANYMILPGSTKGLDHIPYFQADSVILTGPHSISFRSLQSGLDARMALTDARLIRKPHTDTYSCAFAGEISVSADGMALLEGFPFGLDGDVGLDFKPFSVHMRDYSLSLGNVQAYTSLAFVNSDNPRVDRFSCSVKDFKLSQLLPYLPPSLLPAMTGVEADVTVNANARLMAPYVLNSQSLPSLEVDIRIPQGKVSFPVRIGDSSHRLHFQDISLSASYIFDGNRPQDSYITLNHASFKEGQTSVSAHGRMTSLMRTPHVSSSLTIQTGLDEIAKWIPRASEISPKGDAEATVGLAFDLSPDPSLLASAIDVKAQITIVGLDISPGHEEEHVAVPSIHINCGARGFLTPTGMEMDHPVSFLLDAPSVLWNYDNTTLGLDRLSVKGVLKSLAGLNATTVSDIGRVWVKGPRNRLQLDRVCAVLDLSPAALADTSAFAPIPYAAPADQRWLDTLPHTAPYLTAGRSPRLTALISNWHPVLDLRIDAGRWDIEDYPHPFLIGSTWIETDLDTVTIHRISVKSGVSSAALSGSASGLRRLLAFRTPSDLQARLSLNCGTVDINQIAKATKFATEPQAPGTGDDTARKSTRQTPALLLPRNIKGTVDLHSDHTLYTNLDISPLDAHIRLSDGDAYIDSLSLGAGFGSADMHFKYLSGDIQRLGFEGYLSFEDICLTGMYGKFHQLMEMIPQMRNLTGTVSLGTRLSFGLFPDMCLDMPSLDADIWLEGKDLKVHQNHFIHHLASMMLIRSHDDIHIADVGVHARAHGNLLQLDPFDLCIDRYRLHLLGINNFAGDLDYHIAVLRSPLPFPFGINIQGTYHRPRVHFGGAGWHSSHALEITSGIERSFTLDFSKALKRFGGDFMRKAASGTSL